MRIGVDLGGTKIIGGLVDKDGRVLVKRRIPTEAFSGYEAIVLNIIRLIRGIMENGGAAPDDVERIGIACAGQIERYSRRIVFSPNLGFHNAPIADDVERALSIETFVENDVNAATYGEWRFNLKEGPRVFLGIFVGTGIGGGLILDGKLYRGFSNVGGEIGHMTLNPYGYPCRCGNTGCFEAYCGGSYIAERVRNRLKEGYRGRIWSIIGGDMESLNAGHIEAAYLEGDELCTEVWEEVIEYMGAGLATLLNLLNPEMIVFGGGVVYGSRHLIEQAAEVMRKRAMAPSLVNVRIAGAGLGEDAAIVGAAFVEP